MLDLPIEFPFNVIQFLQNRATTFLVFLYQVIALVCFAILPFWAFQWTNAPFLGAFVEHTLVLNTVKPTHTEAWGLRNRDLPFGYRIVSLDNQHIASVEQLNQLINEYQVGQSVPVELRSPQGILKTYNIKLQKFPAIDLLNYFGIPYVIGLIFLFVSIYIFNLRRSQPAGRAFALFTVAVAVASVALFDRFTTNHLIYLWTFSLAIAGGALFNLGMLFPEEFKITARYSFFRWFGYLPAALLVFFAFPTLYNYSDPLAYSVAWRIEYIFSVLAGMFFLVVTFLHRSRSTSPIVREQARLIIWGFVISFGPVTTWFVITTINPRINFTPYLMLTLIVFPIATGYAIVRYRLLNADYLLSRGTLYALLAVIAATGYGLLVSGLSLLVGGALQPTNPYMVGLMVFILAVLLNPLRSRLQHYVDRAFFRDQVVYRDRLQDFGRELTQALDLSAIVSLLRQYTLESLLPSRLHIFIYEPLDEQYIAFLDEKKEPTTDIRFSTQSALVKVLSSCRDAFIWGDSSNFPKALKSDAARLALLGSQVFIPLPGRQSLTGWMALGSLKSGDPFSSRDFEFLSSLCDQAALAVERAQVVSDLERNVREMDVLTRVVQGTNFTLAFDDILELIYAQTNQVIPTRDFRVTLFDKVSTSFYHTFYLVDDERLEDLEQKPLSTAQSLEIEVIRSQQAILTDDYERECRNRGLTPVDEDIYAWMGVPLNAGPETIGVISLGSRNPSQIYVAEQLNLMQAIADQASGSIVKAKLLQESENRARQLAMLNEIGQSLVSTLELNTLLNQILVNASEIINCEAGSLFLVDPQTDELIFEVVIGPVASDLVGRRLPPGKGVVGEAITTRRAIIANDVHQNKEWFDKTDEQTGFTTQDLLVAPLQVKDRVIGVIELINKVNRLPFNQSDEELLTTFASQATIAIENARLYTLTDQALAARVEELSMMQRIDRDLNTSLDILRAMQITLEWAMRHSAADAGLVGSIDQHGVRVMAAEGFSDELGPYRNNGENAVHYLPAHLSSIQRAIRGGQTECVYLDGGSENVAASTSDDLLFKDARSQIVVPIRRENEVIGILLLESTVAEKYPEDVIAFLTRLSDHAAIAIANAQLYAEVESANLAKSKFVSFVAHELKNPMASIKGYTELVSGGMAGPVTDMQASFLSTVRTNVDRMNTIVSDLNDLTKIQVGSLRLDFKSVRVSDVVDESIRTLRKQIDAKEQILHLDIPEEMQYVWADPLRLGQILTNLISNANKYSNQGGNINIGVESSSETRESAGFEAVHIWVRDEGIGIPQEDQEKIFQQYFRTEISKETATGTGLGLNISRSLVEMQGGRIWFESEEGKGTTFHFTVPVAEAA